MMARDAKILVGDKNKGRKVRGDGGRGWDEGCDKHAAKVKGEGR